MASEQGEALLYEWKERLGLQEWRIKLIDDCKPEDMTVANVAGCTDWNETVKAARIEIINPIFYGERIVPFDYEKTLVHELLHLKTCLVSDAVDDLQERYMHQLIDDMARALMSAKAYGYMAGYSDMARRMSSETSNESNAEGEAS